MTDYSKVANSLKQLLGCSDEEISSYEQFVENAVSYITPLLKDSQQENDSRIIYLCAVKAFYQIKLIEQIGDDDISSFTAGDVSYSKGTSHLDDVKRLVEEAVFSCKDLLVDTGFAFKVV